MEKMIIYHGSENIIKEPSLQAGKKYNDYGQGFYCTENIELAKEWACKNEKDGFVNAYSLDVTGLKILNLNQEEYTILNWIAILLKNRFFSLDNDISKYARNYLIEHFYIDISQYDIVIGYRADDSYFSFAESFVSNSLPLSSLYKALCLGKLGEQAALVSENAFAQLTFLEAVPVESFIYYPKFHSRDVEVRQNYRNEIAHNTNIYEDIFVLDIIRQEMRNNDLRIQRIISK